MDRHERLRRLLEMIKRLWPETGIDGLVESLQSGGEEGVEERLDVGRSFNETDEAVETLDVLHHRGLNVDVRDEQLEQLEAIIHKRERPAVDIIKNKMKLEHLTPSWRHLKRSEVRDLIEAPIPLIGRIEIPGNPEKRPYAGTGFVAGPNLLMTNRHVSELFASGLGNLKLTVNPGQVVEVDFEREIKSTTFLPLKIEKLLMIHPYWDMALLQVRGLPNGHSMLSLSVEHPEDLVRGGNRDVVTIGYPYFDDRNNEEVQREVFRDTFGVKRLQPGKMRTRRNVVSYGKPVNCLGHDCSTLGGNSGSAVVDVRTGYVVGLHFCGEYLDMNFAVPTHELAIDSHVVDAGVNFIGRLPPGDDYSAAWRLAESAQPASAGRMSAGPGVQAPEPLNAPRRCEAHVVASVMIPIHVEISIGEVRIATGAPTAATGPTDTEGMFRRDVTAPTVEFAPDFSLESLTAPGFDWRAALSMALASELAYEDAAAVQSKALGAWQLRTCDFIDQRNTQCFVAFSSAAVLVAFRGTKSLGNWLADLNALSTPQHYGTVHRGFYYAFEDVREQIEQKLSRIGGRPVLLTGHSLGGALATLAAAEWHEKMPVSAVYTFGQPRVGKIDFQSYVDDRYLGTFYRFVNNNDIVPRVPPGYQHVGKLIHFGAQEGLEAGVESPKAGLQQTELPPLTESEFDELRATLLAARARSRTAGAPEALEMPELEGIFPSFSDHSLELYIQKILKHTS